MDLKSFLIEKRTAVLAKWLDDVLRTYPQQTAEFLRNRKDQFANPVGHIISGGISGIFDALLSGLDSGAGEKEKAGKMAEFLDNIIRVRAIQDFSASQAVGFIFSLKKAVRDEIDALGQEGGLPLYRQLGAFDGAVDKLALAAFDVYAGCREKIHELKANEVRNQTFRLLRQANIVCEISEPKGGGNGENPQEKIG